MNFFFTYYTLKSTEYHPWSKTVCSCPSFWVVWCCVVQDGKNETRYHWSVRPNCVLQWGSSHKGFTADGLGHLVNLRKPDLHFRHPQQSIQRKTNRRDKRHKRCKRYEGCRDASVSPLVPPLTDLYLSISHLAPQSHMGCIQTHQHPCLNVEEAPASPANTAGPNMSVNAIKKHWKLRCVTWKNEPLTWGLGIASATSIIFYLFRVNKAPHDCHAEPICFNANLALTIVPLKTLIPDRRKMVQFWRVHRLVGSTTIKQTPWRPAYHLQTGGIL